MIDPAPRAPAQIRHDLIARREIAILDVREEALFASGHPLFAANLPFGTLELDALYRIPRRDCPIVLYDDGAGIVPEAALRLRQLGYSNVQAMQGDLEGWRAAGYELFTDVNSYCKAFGELVESRRHTPSLSAQQVRAMIDAGADAVILDARPFEEYAAMSIPTGVNVPGAELVLRARMLAPDPETTIVVNCAGRTRSLVGAQSLINAGLPNPVAALRNGAIGWVLAGLALDHHQSRQALDRPPDATTAEARRRAREVAYRAGVKRLDRPGLENLRADAGRTLYRFDVRTHEEFLTGRPEGFIHAPGGQLVQETDAYAPVRGARIVLYDEIGPRADMTASWLAQMGCEAYVLESADGLAMEAGPWTPPRPPPPVVRNMTVQDLAAAQDRGGVLVVDLQRSDRYRRAHIPGAAFARRSQLAAALNRAAPETGTVVVTCEDGALAAFAAAGLELEPGRDVRALKGGNEAWKAAGLPLVTDDGLLLSEDCDVYKRPYVGTNSSAAAMQAYLDWESGLVAQLARDATHGFFVI